jgi:hypothetical protein
MISADNPGTSLIPTGSDGTTEPAAYEVCNLCEAVGDGNATCWACVERWTFCDTTELVAILRTRAPGKPTGREEVSAFVEKLERITSQPPAPTRRPFKPDQHRVNRGDWRRASGLTICAICHFPFADHADVRGYEWLQRLCDGRLVKL